MPGATAFAGSAKTGHDVLRTLNVVVCGSGNGGLFSCLSSNVSIYLSQRYEKRAAQMWDDIQANGGGITVNDMIGKATYQGKLARVTCNAAEVLPMADVVVVVLPATAHEALFEEISPYLSRQMVVFLPGNSGWNMLLLQNSLGQDASNLTVVATKALPWACRKEGPATVNIRGIKDRVFIVVLPDGPMNTYLATQLLEALCPHSNFVLEDNVMEATLLPFNLAGNPILHPGIMYARWHDYAGEELDAQPLFYNDATPFTVESLTGLWTDLKATVEALSDLLDLPELPLPTVQQMMIFRYGKDIADKSSLLTTLCTNKAYANLTHPMQPTPSGKWLPDFMHRYLSEDLPFGLVPMKGVAELLGVPSTPWFDRVITWGQQLIGKCYLVDGKLTGPDVATSAAPQRFGHKSIEDLIVFRPASLPASAIDSLRSKAQAARFVRTASICAGLPCDTAAAAQADEEEALAAAIADGAADDFSAFEIIEDIRSSSCHRQQVASVTGRAPSNLGRRSFMRQSSTKLPLGLDREASAVLAANLQSALHLAGISSCLEQRGGSFCGGSLSLGSTKGLGMGSAIGSNVRSQGL
ncbi:6-phosphogluconate dehydrogenase [Scenedesmus sp. NREL 46B-D3]|nr:6-phosphogluconate dehydrogenase [Scenedesmus sp. NREL 46B-D3]